MVHLKAGRITPGQTSTRELLKPVLWGAFKNKGVLKKQQTFLDFESLSKTQKKCWSTSSKKIT